MYRSVLLIDDDADDQLLFNDAMHCVDSSVRFDRADNGLHALNKLRSTKLLPDLIFVDLNMPLVSGYEFISQLKNDASLSHIPVIAFTTSKSVLDAEQAQSLGANAFVTKPGTYQELCAKLRRILQTDFTDVSQEHLLSDTAL